jgi:hypothetical protein
VADIVRPGDFPGRLAGIAPLQGLTLLVGSELGLRRAGLAAHLTPRALASLRPSPVRARISSRPNSARPLRTVSIRRPWAVVVSAQVSLRDRKPAFRPVIVARVLREDRA